MEDCILMPVCFTDEHSFSGQLLHVANSFLVSGGGSGVGKVFYVCGFGAHYFH